MYNTLILLQQVLNMSDALQFSFDKVLFFGRSVQEYRTMFNFNPEEYKGKRVLDCCGGPAALAAAAGGWGVEVVACDPLYAESIDTLRKRVDEDVAVVDQLQAKTLELFDEDVRRAERRRDDMNVFLSDFVDGKRQGRYVAASLPKLPFDDRSFDVTLCGNFLFLYSSTESGGIMKDSPFGYEFHLASLKELMRVTEGEVRLYPLNGPEVERHSYLDPLMEDLAKSGVSCELVPVPHKDIKTAIHLLSMRWIT